MRLGVLVAVLALLVAPLAVGSTWYVNKACPSSTQDGLAWDTAFTTLQGAIDVSAKGDEIWVVGGTYDEARNDATGAVLMKTGVALYGGFAGTETQRDARDWIAHSTTIDGATARAGSVAWHTIMGADDAVLDGFTVTGGYASGSGDAAKGGGLYNAFASPTVANCILSGNVADEKGGGIYNYQASPVFRQCTIRNNSAPIGAGMCGKTSSPQMLDCTFSTNAASQSGGAASSSGSCFPLFLDCTISGNTASIGAGIENTGMCSPEIVRCTFDANVASGAGGALANRVQGTTVTARYCTFSNNQAAQGGAASDDAVTVEYWDCTFTHNTATADAGGALAFTNAYPRLVRCKLNNNAAARGGAVYNLNGPVMVANCLFWGNTATLNGGAGYFAGPQKALFWNASFWGNTATGNGGAAYFDTGSQGAFANDILYGDTPNELGGADVKMMYSDIEGGHDGGGNLQVDPQFRDAAAGDLSLLSGSPCIDAGTRGDPAIDDLINAPDNDILGTPRPQPTVGEFDMGAYEYGEAGPAADWLASPTMGMVPLTVVFADLSLPGTATPMTWLWDFGDGVTSTQQHPMHTYTRGGRYTVSLTANTSAGSNTLPRTGYIVVNGGPSAAFTATPSSGAPPLAVQFVDTSAPGRSSITSWAWDFGDGASSTAQSPSHTYATAAVRTATLTVDSATGSSVKTMLVNVGGPTAAFAADITVGYEPMTVQFTNQSPPGLSPITGYLWDFGDSTTSTSASPTHLYTNPGFYTVSMTVTSAVGSTTETKTAYIRIYRRFYVDAASTASSPNGTSWALALKTIIEGIDAGATAGAPGEVWVAAGTYAEARANATGSVTLKSGVDIYGGFNKTEITRDQRNPQTHVTTIDGSTSRDGSPAYHVVLGADNVTLDGFTITGGRADDGIPDNGAPEDTGGGMLNYYTSPTVAHCVFIDNYADEGGAMMNYRAAPIVAACTFSGNTGNLDGGGVHNYFAGSIITDCVFTSNTSSSYGGAMYNEKTSGTSIVRCSFTENHGGYGGAMFNYYADSISIDCTFTGNEALYGGAVYTQHAAPVLTRCVFGNNAASGAYGQGGAMFNIMFAAPIIDSCIFSGNTAEYAGAGICNNDRAAPALANCLLAGNIASVAAGGMYNVGSNPNIVNCTFADNQAPQGGAMFNYNCMSPNAVLNCIFWNQAAAQEIADIGGVATLARFSDIRGASAFAGTGNINAAPAFVQSPTDYRLTGASPCVDTGTNTGAASSDLVGMHRPQGANADMGAYEYTVPPTAAFTADTTSGAAPLTVHFTDQSTAGTSPIDDWQWNFGDDQTLSDIQNPTHTYTNTGIYTVSLTVVSDSGSPTATMPNAIAVTSSNALPVNGMLGIAILIALLLLAAPHIRRNLS